MKTLEVLQMVRRMLQDVSNVSQRWNNDELIVWINEACHSVILAKPDAGSKVIEFSLQGDSARQTLPDDASAFIRLISNLASGRAITKSTVSDYDACDPAWRTSPLQDDVRQYMFDELDDKHFWVYPRSSGTVLLEYSALTTVTSANLSTTDLALPDEYVPAVVDYAVYRALAEDNSDSANLERSAVFLEKFNNRIGSKLNSEAWASPATR